MKNILKIALACVFAVCLALSLVACQTDKNSSNKTPGAHYYTNKDGETVLREYVPEEGVSELTVSEDVDKIQAGAFKGNGTLKKIVINSNVTEIGDGAFANMTALEELVLPFVGQSATAVNEKKTFGYLFGTEEYDGGVAVTQNYNASSTATYYIPETLKKVTVNADKGVKVESEGEEATYEGYKLPAYAFHSMNRLESVTLTGNISEVGDYAFYDCYGMKGFVLPESVEKIGKYAFVGCNRVQGVASTAETAGFRFAANGSLEEIGDYAFAGSFLTEIVLPEGVTKIGEGAFASVTTGLTVDRESKLEKVTLPQSLKEISKYAFFKCVNLTEVVYSDSLETVGIGAFEYCDKLQLVKNASSSETVPADGKVGKIVVGASVLKVEAGAFANMGNEVIVYSIEKGAAAYVNGWNANTKGLEE